MVFPVRLARSGFSRLVGAALVALAVALPAVSAGAAAPGRSGPVFPAGATPLASPNVYCPSYGIVVAEIFASWSPALPPSGDCWTTVRPATNTGSFTLCDTLKQQQSGSGPNWDFDDTNPDASPSDGTIDDADCHSHDTYYVEWMSRAHGYVWDFSPEYVIEEDYTSASHSNLSYEGSRSKGAWGHTDSSFANVPGLDAAGSNVASYIAADCHKVVVYTGTLEYMIGLYNDVNPPSGNESAIVAALNKCFPG